MTTRDKLKHVAATLVADPRKPSISFADDGTWSGSDGCNRMGGTWTTEVSNSSTWGHGVSSAIVHFGEELFSTAMACPDMDSPRITFVGDYVFFVRQGQLMLRDASTPNQEEGSVYLYRFEH